MKAVLFILLLISNLFCTNGEEGEGGIESPPPLPLPPRPGLSEFTLPQWRRKGGGGGYGDKVNSLSHCGGEGRGGRGRGGPLEGVGPENHIKLATYSTRYRIQNTEYRIQNTPAAKLEYIKLPMYLFFHMAFGLIIFDWGKSFTRAIGSGPTPSNGP